jgi:hypothetical protein
MNTNEIIAKFMGYKPLFIEEARSEMNYPRDIEMLTEETLYIKEGVDIPFDLTHEDVNVCYSEDYNDGHISLELDPVDIEGENFKVLRLDCKRLSVYDDWKELIEVKREINRRDLEIRACYDGEFLKRVTRNINMNKQMERMNNCLIEVDLVGFKYFASKYIQLITKNK